VRHPRDRGLILVWAVGVLGVLTALGVAVGRRALRTEDTMWQLAARAQADALLRSAVTVGGAALDAHLATGAADTLTAPWARPTRRRLGAGWIEIEIEDLGRRIDLNAVEMRPVLAKLAEHLGLPRTVVPSIADWIDADDDARPDGAEAPWYAAQPAGIRPANAPLESLSHLRLVRDVSPAVFARLAPYVTVHGQPSLNPNTASRPVLDAWLGDETRVAHIIRVRTRSPVDCVGLQRCTLRSRRFLIHARAGVGPVERRADVVVLVAPGLAGSVESWEPPTVPDSDRGGERRRPDRLAQLP
jgi:type II secretory pathway component PulK